VFNFVKQFLFRSWRFLERLLKKFNYLVTLLHAVGHAGIGRHDEGISLAARHIQVRH
jgi:hypothetical protein